MATLQIKNGFIKKHKIILNFNTTNEQNLYIYIYYFDIFRP